MSDGGVERRSTTVLLGERVGVAAYRQVAGLRDTLLVRVDFGAGFGENLPVATALVTAWPERVADFLAALLAATLLVVLPDATLWVVLLTGTLFVVLLEAAADLAGCFDTAAAFAAVFAVAFTMTLTLPEEG